MNISKATWKINSKKCNFHDDIIETLLYDREKKRIIIRCLDSTKQNNQYELHFHNVIGFKMSACVFWGGPEYILDCEIMPDEKAILILEFKKEWEKVPQVISLPNYDNLVEILFTLTSGDKLRIACESFEIIRKTV